VVGILLASCWARDMIDFMTLIRSFFLNVYMHFHVLKKFLKRFCVKSL
jgi:hypothetical protein